MRRSPQPAAVSAAALPATSPNQQWAHFLYFEDIENEAKKLESEVKTMNEANASKLIRDATEEMMKRADEVPMPRWAAFALWSGYLISNLPHVDGIHPHKLIEYADLGNHHMHAQMCSSLIKLLESEKKKRQEEEKEE